MVAAKRVIVEKPELPARHRFALALQAAVKTLEGIDVALAEGDTAHP
jgi:hypothetical protein